MKSDTAHKTSPDAGRGMSKPTPGPWHTGGIFNPDSDHPTVNIWGPTRPGDASGELVAREVRFHNAPLLESAPELLEACTAFVADLTDIARCSYTMYDGDGKAVWNDEVWKAADPDGFQLVCMGRAAIAKARP